MVKQRGIGAALRRLFTGGAIDESSFEELEDLLIQADIGAAATMEIVDKLRDDSRKERITDHASLAARLVTLLGSRVAAAEISPDPDQLTIYLVLGVNGVGKTTTIAKLASRFQAAFGIEGIVLAAGDTFRAAAVEQLEVHAERLGMRFVSQGSGADPAAVIYDAITSAISRGDQIVLADTAGRMHTKANLVNELGKIVRVVEKRAGEARLVKLLVIDATTGQNGLRQAETFQETVGVDAVVLAKYDSTAKGGILVPLYQQLGIPAAYLGTGEHYDGLADFDPQRYAAELVGT